MVRCIAIDDEPLALRQIKSYIERTESLSLVATCRSAIEAQQILEEQKIDLIFVDINMPDLNGIDFVRSLAGNYFVIFTTAYSEFALEGFKLNAIDYLLKPFTYDEFTKAIQKVVSLVDLVNRCHAAENAIASPIARQRSFLIFIIIYLTKVYCLRTKTPPAEHTFPF